MTSGFTPVHAEDTILQRGDKPLFLASSSVIITTAAAPSLMEDEFPAVTDPVPSYKKMKMLTWKIDFVQKTFCI